VNIVIDEGVQLASRNENLIHLPEKLIFKNRVYIFHGSPVIGSEVACFQIHCRKQKTKKKTFN